MNFKIWRTITIGTRKITDEDLDNAGFYISDWAHDMLQKIRQSRTNRRYRLVVLSLAELGIEEGANYTTICSKGKKLGLQLCPAKMGPALRLNYRNKFPIERLIIAMNPIYVSGKYPAVFVVETWFVMTDRYLSEEQVGKNSFFYPSDEYLFVFTLPKKE